MNRAKPMDHTAELPPPQRKRTPIVLVGVVGLWTALAAVAGLGAGRLNSSWPSWPLAFAAAAIWGLNILLLVYGVGRPLSVSSVPFLAVAFAFAMTLVGSANYWAATELYPSYRADIERAAC